MRIFIIPCNVVSRYDQYTNDIAWYNKYPHMFNDATSVQFNVIGGEHYEDIIGAINNTGTATEKWSYNAPGIITLDYVPGIGVTKDANDATNRAFQALWAAIYSKTSGFLQFPAYTLATTIVAAQSMGQNIGYLKCALEVSNAFTPTNNYFPRGMLFAMGIDPDSILGKQQNVRWRLNNCIREFNKLCIPDFLDLFIRHYRLARNIYADADNQYAQFIKFRPAGYYLYNDLGVYDTQTGEYVTDDNGKAVHRCDFYVMPYIIEDVADDPQHYKVVDVSDLLDIIELQLKVIQQSSDFKFILGAVQRAFDSHQFVKIDPVDADAKPTVAVDDNVLSQIANANFVGAIQTSLVTQPAMFTGQKWHYDTFDIYGDLNHDLVLYTPGVRGKGSNATGDIVLNSYDEVITREWVMEATRCIATLDPNFSTIEDGRGSYQFHRIEACGADFITQIGIIKYDQTLGDYSRAQFYGIIDALEQVPTACALLKFKYAPRLYIVVDNKVREFFGDLNHWGILDRRSLSQLHDTAMVSMMEPTGPIPIKLGF
uniref:Capsid protein n=1 Tax=Dromedary picobirnavirus TaxID=1574421 RepID=A0A0A1ENY1_9VIRU|nr:capsid protein [Dromedary picobirnavirus]